MGVDHREGTVQGRRILVIANETVSGVVLHEAIRFRARNVGGEVLVVAPAIDAPPRGLTAGGDGARRAAEQRLSRSLDRLRAAGINARGQIGDGEPLQAIADALDQFAADEIIIATHPERRSGWLGHDLVARARVRFDQPVLHIVVDLERQREQGPDGPRRVVRGRRPPRRPGPGTPSPSPTLTAS
jgi:universal stress protein family protein